MPSKFPFSVMEEDLDLEKEMMSLSPSKFLTQLSE